MIIIDQAIHQVSQMKGIKAQYVKSVNDFFWKSLKERLASYQDRSIYVDHLGTFSVSPYKLNQAIIKMIRTIRQAEQQQRHDKATGLRSTLKIMCAKRSELAKQMYEKSCHVRAKYASRYATVDKVQAEARS